MSELVRLMVGPAYPDNIQFGRIIRWLREENSFSRSRAADLVGLSAEYLRLIERGDRAPAAGTAKVMFEAYGVPLETKVVDDHYVLTFREYEIEFASRIQEARNRSQPIIEAANRNEQIGRIVSLLTIADEKMLNDIYHKLRRT